MGVDVTYRMPAEWEPHRATWISWPHHEPDWPGKLGPIPWVYAEIARVIAEHETVEILCASEEIRAAACDMLDAHAVRRDRVRLHIVPTDRVWLRDSAPTGVHRSRPARSCWLNWAFNALGEVRQLARRTRRSARPSPRITGAAAATNRCAPTAAGRIVLEGGGIDVNGDGLLLVTEEWLLSDVQVRNPGLTRADYEQIFADWLGVRQTIWLGEGCVGDDTHGHVDDVARFVDRDTIVLAVEDDPSDENHARSMDNLRRLERAARRRQASARCGS